jgi:transcriptional regulator with XRE-family HTH domain
MNIGEKIQNLRKNNNLSQELLAEKIGVTRQTISKWELNETTPDIKQAVLLASIFNISINELINNKINEKPTNNKDRLYDIIIKILKISGVILLTLVIIDILSLVFFAKFKTETEIHITGATMNCNINDKSFYIDIEVYEKTQILCEGCDDEQNKIIKKIFNENSLETSIKLTEKYFIDLGGNCKQ